MKKARSAKVAAKKSATAKRKSSKAELDSAEQTTGPAVRSIWSGTITFGLVSIPVDLLTAVRARQTAMKLIDTEGHALGRQYHCSKDGKELDNDELVRGYKTADGKVVAITDAEFDSVAPEMSADITLKNFVPAAQIPPVYFQKSYFLAPAGKSSRAYNLLAATMQRTDRVGIGSFVMRGQEYLVAIVSDSGVLRADTLRYADEVRSPESIGLPKHVAAPAKLIGQFNDDIAALRRDELSITELEDKEAAQLLALVKTKEQDSTNVIHQPEAEDVDDEVPREGAQIIDLMARLRQSLSKRAVATNVENRAPILLAERRALRSQKESAAKSPKIKKSTRAKKSARAKSSN